jgi:hypothetical protein
MLLVTLTRPWLSENAPIERNGMQNQCTFNAQPPAILVRRGV